MASCVICLQTCESSLTTCSHLVHTACVETWLQISRKKEWTGKCFVCNQSIRDVPPSIGDILKQNQDDAALPSWFRRCPMCQIPIDKDGGCDNVICLCGTSFCFECGHQSHQCSCIAPEENYEVDRLDSLVLFAILLSVVVFPWMSALF
jgi:hypothetical protein